MISIPKKIWNQMVDHAKTGYPNEACGILAGKDAQAAVFYPMSNLDQSSISYFMDPKEQLKVMKEMRANSLDMIGIFHSHVASEAYPSQKDVRLAFYPELSYLIVSLSDSAKPVLRSFKIVDEKITEEAVTVL